MLGPRVVGLVAVVLLGCTEPSALVVDMRTDLVPGVEFDVIRTEVLDGASAGERIDHAVDATADYAAGQRAAELAGLEEESITLRVSLLREGVVVLERPVRVSLGAASNAVTILLPGSCSGVVCAGGQACLAGACVDDRCAETATEFCEAGCASVADCGAAASCATVECTPSGACFTAPDHASCGADAFCAADAGCVGYLHDLGAGLTANLVPDAGAGVDAAQEGVDGWWYHYHPRSAFAEYGPLSLADMDPASWTLFERARLDTRGGWFTPMALSPGTRAFAYVHVWDTGFGTDSGDSIMLAPENTLQPVVEWRAPTTGMAELDLEVRARDSDGAEADVDVIVFAVTAADGAVELDHRYVSRDGLPDANGHPTEAAPMTAPLSMRGAARLEAGDGIFLYARVGDDDAFDLAVLRGGVRFTPAR